MRMSFCGATQEEGRTATGTLTSTVTLTVPVWLSPDVRLVSGERIDVSFDSSVEFSLCDVLHVIGILLQLPAECLSLCLDIGCVPSNWEDMDSHVSTVIISRERLLISLRDALHISDGEMDPFACSVLQLCGGRVSALPESFGQLLALQRLELGVNELSMLPDSFGKLVALETLDLAANRLETLPESFGGLLALHKLGLNGNHLSMLPESFGQLLSLQTLNLCRNHLSTLKYT